jgi:hypothetical protein
VRQSILAQVHALKRGVALDDTGMRMRHGAQGIRTHHPRQR